MKLNHLRWIVAVTLVSSSFATFPPALATSPAPTPTWTFSTCGQSGRLGPTAQQCTTAYSSTALAGSVDVVSGIQFWSVPATGTYDVEVAGASSAPGLGAQFTTTLSLTAGQQLKILVGQQGVCGDGCGGGGGTFVAAADNTPLAVAGGGGARSRNWGDWFKERDCEANGRFDTRGGRTREAWAWMCGNYNGFEGHDGNGGAAWWCGTGGGGFFGDGASSCWDPFRGGRAFVNGGAGGWSQCGSADGGFGGGGAGYGCGEGSGGGGGGYSGGGGADAAYTCWYYCAPRVAGGGGSYAVGGMANRSGRDGAGFVTIRWAATQGLALRSSGSSSVDVVWSATAPDSLGSVIDVRVATSTDGQQFGPDSSAPFVTGRATVAGLPCAENIWVRVTVVGSLGSDMPRVFGPVRVGSDALRFCEPNPRLSLPGQQVSLRFVGADPGGQVVAVSIGGVVTTATVNSDGTGEVLLTPMAAGRIRISANQLYADPLTRRFVKRRGETMLWTSNVRVPATAVVGRPVSLSASYLPPGTRLSVTGPSNSVVMVAGSNGSAKASAIFTEPGVRQISVTDDKGLVLISGSVLVTRGR